MHEPTARRFLDRLWELQAEHGLTDRQLARILGVSRQKVTALRAGARSLGAPEIVNGCRHWPELANLLRSDVPEGNTDVPPGTGTMEGAA